MAYTVFVSHSMQPGDSLIDLLCVQLRRNGISFSVTERDQTLSDSLANRIAHTIRSSDCVIALLTERGSACSDVMQDVCIALSVNTEVFYIVEKNVDAAWLQPGEYLEIDRTAPADCAAKISASVRGLKIKKEIRTVILWVLVATLCAIFVYLVVNTGTSRR